MRRTLALCLLFVVCGCSSNRPAPPPPEITVERVDSTEFTGVTIYYNHHTRPQNSATYVTLNSPEEIRAYKKQVEFLLTRLEEAEKRMGVHEPEETDPNVP